MELDQSVHGFGAAVVGAAGVEVAEELAAPLSQGASEAGDFGDRAAGEVSRTWIEIRRPAAWLVW